MKPFFLKSLCLFFLAILLFSCETEEKSSFILDENFDSNTRGWMQEDADYHYLEIKDGYYYIQNSDSSSGRTSCKSLDRSYLFDLPEKYSITTSMNILGSDLDTAFCGFILESATFEYRFRFFETGEIEVKQYSYAMQEWASYNDILPLENKTKFTSFDVEINIDGWSFDLYVNDEWLGDGRMSAKNWSRIAPFVGKFTSMEVDYLRIQEWIEEENEELADFF